MELEAGAVILGKLRLLRPLGQGGMGVVWSARHLSLDTDVAVKFIRPDRIADPASYERFEREAKAAARIAHPHVVRVMDYGRTEDAVPFIVMELLCGASLAELLERGGRLSLATAKSLLAQVGSALECAHEHGIVHRDIKPQNVFITQGSKGLPLIVKVLDFGVAKIVDGALSPAAGSTLTQTGVVIGSPPYMSPEQLEARRDIGVRSDLWSLGVIVYETLTGAPPFQGSSFVGVGAAVLSGKYQPASTLRPDLPASLDHWFAKALCVDPDARFQSAREMVDAFVEHEESADVASERAGPVPTAATSATADHAPPATASRWRRRPMRALFAAAGFVAIGLGVGWAGLGRSARSSGCPPGMVLIGGSTFHMGSAEEAETPTDETPAHDEIVASFCLDVTEVTVKAYSACASCDRAPMTVEFEGLTPNGRAFESQFCNGSERSDHPINCVDWRQAKSYCAAQGKRLPTEQEWELAARGREGRTYPWGNEAPSGERLNACGSECRQMLTERLGTVGKGPWPSMYGGDDAAPATAPVGSYRAGASAAGVLDLAGNVWEWTESVYCPYGRPDCGDSRRVLRGGAWDTTERSDVRAARRFPGAPAARGRSIGFRCAKTP